MLRDDPELLVDWIDLDGRGAFYNVHSKAPNDGTEVAGRPLGVARERGSPLFDAP